MSNPLSVISRTFVAFSLCLTLTMACVHSAAATDTKREADSLDRVPTIYVIPLKGQMGTDIHPSVIEDLIKDVNKANPDIVIYELDSADIDTIYHRANDDRKEAGMVKIEEFRDILEDLHEKIDARQVMWIKDSVGISSLFALGWEEMYMKQEDMMQYLEKH